MILLALTACRDAGSTGTAAPESERSYTAFGHPERILIRGYGGQAMEPFISRDGRHLFFNNSNAPGVNTNLHYAERITDVTFAYKGEAGGANSEALDAVPTMDRANNFYFVSTRSYRETLATIYRGRFTDGVVTGIEMVAGISQQRLGAVNFDVEVSADGNTLYFADGTFSGKPVPEKADIALARRDGDGFQRSPDGGQLLKNVNTGALEYAACISTDELEMFFTRLTGGGPAIYRSARKTVAMPFDPPERVVAIEGFAEAPTLSPDGRSLYYHQKAGEQFVVYRVTRSL